MNQTSSFLRSSHLLFAAMTAAVVLAGCASADQKRPEMKPAAVAPTPSAPIAPAASASPSAPANPAEAATTNSVIRINAGADASFTDSSGNVLLSDRGFTRG